MIKLKPIFSRRSCQIFALRFLGTSQSLRNVEGKMSLRDSVRKFDSLLQESSPMGRYRNSAVAALNHEGIQGDIAPPVNNGLLDGETCQEMLSQLPEGFQDSAYDTYGRMQTPDNPLIKVLHKPGQTPYNSNRVGVHQPSRDLHMYAPFSQPAKDLHMYAAPSQHLRDIHMYAPFSQPARLFSTDSGKQGKDREEVDESKLSNKDKLKRAVAQYGSTVIVFHVCISLISLGGFYLAVSSGLDLVSLLGKLGVGQSILESKAVAGAGTFVVAYAVHKVFAPARIAITLTSTPFIVRYLRGAGILKTPKP